MYPMKNVMAMSDNLMGNHGFIPHYGFWEWILILHFRDLYCVCLFLIIAVHLLVLSFLFKTSIATAAVGAYVFTFGIRVILKLNHIRLLPNFFVPFVIFYMISFYFDRLLRDIHVKSAFVWEHYLFFGFCLLSLSSLLYLLQLEKREWNAATISFCYC